jgi:hypothetical protein
MNREVHPRPDGRLDRGDSVLGGGHLGRVSPPRLTLHRQNGKVTTVTDQTHNHETDCLMLTEIKRRLDAGEVD